MSSSAPFLTPTIRVKREEDDEEEPRPPVVASSSAAIAATASSSSTSTKKEEPESGEDVTNNTGNNFGGNHGGSGALGGVKKEEDVEGDQQNSISATTTTLPASASPIVPDRSCSSSSSNMSSGGLDGVNTYWRNGDWCWLDGEEDHTNNKEEAEDAEKLMETNTHPATVVPLSAVAVKKEEQEEEAPRRSLQKVARSKATTRKQKIMKKKHEEEQHNHGDGKEAEAEEDAEKSYDSNTYDATVVKSSSVRGKKEEDRDENTTRQRHPNKTTKKQKNMNNEAKENNTDPNTNTTNISSRKTSTVAIVPDQTMSNNNNIHRDDDNNGPTSKFPSKLHILLQHAENPNQSEIISWLPSGKAFQVHKPKKFAEGMMLQCFDSHITKYKSFQRQLYEFGFRRVTSNNGYGAFYHELFVRDNYELCHNMIRKKKTKKRIQKTSTPAMVPDQTMSTNNNTHRDDDDTNDAMEDVVATAVVVTGTNKKRKPNHQSPDHLKSKKSKNGSIQANKNNSTITNLDDDDMNDRMYGDDDDNDNYYDNNEDDDPESEYDDDSDISVMNKNKNNKNNNKGENKVATAKATAATAAAADTTCQRCGRQFNTFQGRNAHLQFCVGNNTDDATATTTTAAATRWNEMYIRLIAYNKKYQSTAVPRSYKADPQLAGWVDNQRTLYNKNKLANDRINRLNSIGFVWNVHDPQWKEMYERLVTYKKKYKSTCVPKAYEDDPGLANWVNSQRNKKNLPKDRINRLNSIGFVWDVYDALWTKMYERLVTYKKKYKSTCVPTSYEADEQLGRWVADQRTFNNINSARLTEDRKHRLNSINFVWNKKDAQWMEMYEKLVTYKKKHGTTCVPSKYQEDPRLGRWVSNQRKIFKNKGKTKYAADRINRLNRINFV